jgi:hypothetical protein
MSNDKLFYISDGNMSHCGIFGRAVLTGRRDVVDYRFLAKTTT